jgi:hypothetical protein
MVLAGMTDMYHHAQHFSLEMGVSQTFFAQGDLVL